MSTVFVTGASSGFGRLVCEGLAARGHRVFAGIRGLADRLGVFADLAAAGDVRLVPLDVRSDESVTRAFELASRDADGLDALVDNAGVALFGLVEETSPAALSAVLETNLIGVLRVVRAALPLLRRRAPGSCMIHVSSGLARVVVPGMGGYPRDVASAIVALIEAAPGSRPLRRVVDPVYGDRIERLNAEHASAQKELLAGIGLGHLAG